MGKKVGKLDLFFQKHGKQGGFPLTSVLLLPSKKASLLTFSYGAVNPNTTATSWFMGTGNWDGLENNILRGKKKNAAFRAASFFIFIAVGNKWPTAAK